MLELVNANNFLGDSTTQESPVNHDLYQKKNSGHLPYLRTSYFAMLDTPIFLITPTTQQYDWGKIGSSSKVAQFASAARLPGFVLRDESPYAELWMGTHVTSPSRVSSTGDLLSDHLKANQSLIGSRVVQRFQAGDGDLPFLFKVLSIEKALSIQTHPDKATAQKLHKEKPDIYKDSNHKPEMALAITPFTGLCGFLPIPQIVKYLHSTPELAALVPNPVRNQFLAIAASYATSPTSQDIKDALKSLFSALMKADEQAFTAQLDKLVVRYKAGKAAAEEESLVDLVLRLNDQFPNDIGLFCPFLLNHVKLQPGEAIFLGAGEPHAYLSGDIIECMATSDNVIRAGLTPKLRDIPNLVSGLTYEPSEATKHVVKAVCFQSSSTSTLLFDPPVTEFSVLQVMVGMNGTEIHRAIDGPSIAIVTDGRGEASCGKEQLELSVGQVVFIGAGTEVTLTSEQGLVIYRAFVEV